MREHEEWGSCRLRHLLLFPPQWSRSCWSRLPTCLAVLLLSSDMVDVVRDETIVIWEPMTSLNSPGRRECYSGQPAVVSHLTSEYHMRSGSIGCAEEAEHLFLYVLAELALLLAHAGVEQANADLAHRRVEWRRGVVSRIKWSQTRDACAHAPRGRRIIDSSWRVVAVMRFSGCANEKDEDEDGLF
jgi:hypothetical protein